MLYNLKESGIIMIELLNYSILNPPNNCLFRCVCPDFEQELSKIIEKCGNKSAFIGLYEQRLKFLSEKQRSCFLREQWFEKIKYDSNHWLYSIKFKSGKLNKNIRILFIFTNKYPILLCAFDEKKKDSKNSYDNYIKIANDRIEKLIKLKFIERDDILCHNL